MKRIILISVLSLFSLSAFAQGSGQWLRSPGDREFTLAGTGSSDEDLDNSTVGLSLGYGQYVTDRWLIAIRQGLDFAELPGDDSWNGSTRISADYHFGSGPLKLALGGRVGGIYGDDVNETFVAGPAIGVKYYVKPETFIYAEAEYQFFFDDADEVDHKFNDGSFVHTIGIGFNF